MKTKTYYLIIKPEPDGVSTVLRHIAPARVPEAYAHRALLYYVLCAKFDLGGSAPYKFFNSVYEFDSFVTEEMKQEGGGIFKLKDANGFRVYKSIDYVFPEVSSAKIG